MPYPFFIYSLIVMVGNLDFAHYLSGAGGSVVGIATSYVLNTERLEFESR
jgi:hypothetical protein